jgi:hypothetical protein
VAYHRAIDELEATVTPRGPGPRVVLGEAEPDGWLRFVLEGEGADIVGHATSDEELGRVLGGVVPDVIVLDAGISAAAALDARERADGAAIVVVWPSGVASVVAQERVDPARVVEDLGDAVRSAAARTDVATLDDEAHAPDPDELTSPFDGEPASSSAERRRTSRLPVAVASWVVYLTFVAAIASAVPKAFEPPPTGGMRETRQTASPPADPASDDGPAPGVSGTTIDPRDGSGPSGDTTMGQGGSGGDEAGRRPGVRGGQQQDTTEGESRGQNGHGDQKGQDDPGLDEDGSGGKGGGRPEDPGSQGQGGGRPEDPGSQGQGNQGGTPRNQGSTPDGKGRNTNTRGELGAEPDPDTRGGSDRRPEASGVSRPSAA